MGEKILDKYSIVVVSGKRSPIGGLGGKLSALTAPDLASQVIRPVIENVGVAYGDIDEVIIGCVLSAGIGQGPARQAARMAGIPDSVGATTINKLCGSGMKSVMLAHDLILAESAKIIVAGGMESMSNSPYLLDKARSGYRMGHGRTIDHMFSDGLEDAETGKLMGAFAQDVADKYEFTRKEMDDFAISSLNRAMQASNDGSFADEIVPITVKNRKNISVVDVDEQPFNAKIDKIPNLKPAFDKNGTITAANSSSISDGASALLLMTESEAVTRGLKPLARIVAHSTHAQHPSEFTIAPVGAISKVLTKSGWKGQDVDIFEINEAFAVVTMISMKEHNLSYDKVNVFGGACALGHPIGATGARILVTLINALRKKGGSRGIATACIGGGEATAIALELLS